MTSHEKSSGLPFNWAAEVFGAGQQGLCGVTLGAASASAGGWCASLAAVASSVHGRLGLFQHRTRKLGLSQAEIIDPKLSGR